MNWGAGGLLTAAYLLLAGQVVPDEVVAACAGGLAAVLWLRAVGRTSSRRFRFERGTGFAVARALMFFGPATVGVFVVLIRSIGRRVESRSTKQLFVNGLRHEPFDAGRRAVAMLGLSLAPDRFVLRMPEGRDEIEIHTLTGKPPRGDPRWAI